MEPIGGLGGRSRHQHQRLRRRTGGRRLPLQSSRPGLPATTSALLLLLVGLLGAATVVQARTPGTSTAPGAFVHLPSAHAPRQPHQQRGWTLSPTALAAKGKGGGGGGKGGGGGMGREELKNALVAEGLEEILAARAVEAADKAVATWETQVRLLFVIEIYLTMGSIPDRLTRPVIPRPTCIQHKPGH